MSMSEPINEKLKPRLFRSGKPEDKEYDELMSFFDRLMHEKLDKANMARLTTFIGTGISTIIYQFETDNAIHPETLNILIRAIQVYRYNADKPYQFLIYEHEDPNVARFINNIVREAAQREELFDPTQGAYTREQLAAAEAERLAKNSNMEEVDGGAKRKRTTRTKKMKRRHKRKHQRKSKRVTK
jgi:hypothetical protein